MEVEIEYTLERGETEFDVTVRGNVTFDKKGSRRGPPENWTPDEPGETEILSVKREDGTTVELTEKEESLIEDRLYEEACDEAEHDDKPSPPSD